MKSKHNTEIDDYDMEALCEEIGNLRYDALVKFLRLLEKKLKDDSDADKERGRIRLSEALFEVGRMLRNASDFAGMAWDICKDYEICEETVRIMENTPETQKPYIVKLEENVVRLYNPEYGDDKLCTCGHVYYRHFDTYDEMFPIGCKYCDCRLFTERNEK